jgi:beta-N-acetylhexosaminidase
MTTIDPRIGQRFCVGFHGLTAPDYILDWLRTGRIGGVILFARNIESPQQLAELTRTLHAASKTPILIGIDQEGGMVARLRQRQGFTESPGAMALAATPYNTRQTETMSRILGIEMRTLGINWTFAPVLDLSYNAANPTVGTRSFGRDPQQIGALATSAARGFQAAGVVACAKHFPGLGNTAIDSHVDLPHLDIATADLIARDLAPYRQVIAADVGSIMTTHTIFSALDDQHPATLSPVIIRQLVREELGFDGVIATDCLEMQAITKHYGAGESAVLAILADVDILLVSHTVERQEEAIAAVTEAIASGRITDAHLNASNERIQRLKHAYAIQPRAIDASNINQVTHRTQALRIAKQAVAIDGTLPAIDETVRVGVVEFASYMDSDVMEREEPTSFAQRLLEQVPHAEIVALHGVHPTDAQRDRARAIAAAVDVLVIVTRNAHSLPQQHDLARELLAAHEQTILVALRNPYDADQLTATATLLTFGDSTPSLQAATQALVGAYDPAGVRPVAAEV